MMHARQCIRYKAQSMHSFRFPFLTLIVGCVLATSTGCRNVATSAATKLGVTVAQERKLNKAVDDFTIWGQIKHNYLEKDINNLLIGINVKVIEGVVHLTGNVKNPESRINAVRLAWKPYGVKEVINEIQVSQKSDLLQYAKDKWISAQISGKLLANEEVHSINYSSETVNGIVYLMGIARDEKELNLVTHIASRIQGVKRVISHVILKDDPSRNA